MSKICNRQRKCVLGL